MLTNICFYNNKVFIPLIKDCDIFLISYSCKKHHKNQDESFKECFKINIPLSSKYTYANEIFLEVVDNFVTGLKSLLVLVFDSSGTASLFVYCDTFKGKLFRVLLPQWFITENVQPYNLFVSDGPTFLLFSNDVFHLYTLPYCVNKHLNRKFLPYNCRNCKILQFKCLGSYKKDSKNLLFLLIISFYVSSEQRISVIGFNSDSNNSDIDCEQLSISYFFPPCYESVLKAIEVSKLAPPVQSNSGNIKDIEWKKNISLICTEDDCLVFFSGILKYCCKMTIPYSEITCIKSEFSNITSKNINLVLASESKNVYFITMKENSCEVVKYWTDVKAVLIGDFLMKGSKQTLLLKQTDPESWQNNCILTDMFSFIPIDLLSQHAMPDDCLKTTISGLEKKVEEGRSAIKVAEHEISQKSSAAIDALIRLHEFKLNNDCVTKSHGFQESLVDLILSGEENTKMEVMLSESEASVKLLHEKQRFVDNHWVLSLHFINDGTRSICNPSMKVLFKGNQVESIQKLFIHNDDTFSFNDKSRREINPKTNFTILLKFIATFQNEQIYIILSWYDATRKEFDNEIFIREEKKVLLQHQVCFLRTLSLADILNCKIEKGISSSGDLLFARSSQQISVLRISSLYSNISRLESMLMTSDFDTSDFLLLQDSSTNCLIFTNEKSLLFGVHIVFKNVQEKMANIEAFVRNEKDLLMLVHYMYRCLPEDVLISPSLKSLDEISQMKKDVICSMKDEVDLLVSSFNIHNISEELIKNYSQFMSSQSAGTITIPKITYHRIRRALVKKECITDSTIKSFT